MESEYPFISKYRIIFISCNIALGTFQFGYCMTSFNPIQRVISRIENWGEYESLYVGLGTMFLPLGGLAATSYSNYLFNHIGRRKLVYIADFMTIIGAIFSVILNFYCLLISRFIYGLTVGLNMSLVPIFLREFIPRSYFGRFGVLVNVSIQVGFMSTFILAFGLPKVDDIPIESEMRINYWRFMIGFPFFIALIRSLVVRFIFNFETPLYAIHHSNTKELDKYLNLIVKPKFREEFKKNFENDALQKSKISYKELFNAHNISRTKVIIVIAVLRQFSGSNIINFYSTVIIVSSGLISKDKIEDLSYGFNILFGLIQGSISLLGAKFFDSHGRKPIFILGELISSTAHFLLSIFSFASVPEAIPFFILLYGFGFGLFGPVTLTYNAEISNASGQSLSQLVNWIIAIAISLTFPLSKEYIKIEGFFLICGTSCFLGAIYSKYYLKETKGLTRMQIEDLYYKKTSKIGIEYENPETNEMAIITTS